MLLPMLLPMIAPPKNSAAGGAIFARCCLFGLLVENSAGRKFRGLRGLIFWGLGFGVLLLRAPGNPEGLSINQLGGPSGVPGETAIKGGLFFFGRFSRMVYRAERSGASWSLPGNYFSRMAIPRASVASEGCCSCRPLLRPYTFIGSCNGYRKPVKSLVLVLFFPTLFAKFPIACYLSMEVYSV